MVLVPQSTADFMLRVSKIYVPFTCKFPMVLHFVPFLHRRCRPKTNFSVFSYDKTSLKFCGSFRVFHAVFMEKFQKICYLNYMRKSLVNCGTLLMRNGFWSMEHSPPPPHVIHNFLLVCYSLPCSTLAL